MTHLDEFSHARGEYHVVVQVAQSLAVTADRCGCQADDDCAGGLVMINEFVVSR